MNMQEATSKMKADSYKMAALSEDTRNNILAHVKDALIAHKDEILQLRKMGMPHQSRRDLSLTNTNLLM